MSIKEFPILSLITFFPLLGAGIIAFFNKEKGGLIKWTAFFISVVNFIFSVFLFIDFRSGFADMQFVERNNWIESWGVEYHLGVDGISLLLVILTNFLSAIAILSSFQAIKERVKEYYIFLLVLQTGMIGVFLALDLFLFYVFWEGMLIPMYFLIGVWGGQRRIYATLKFFLYTMAGSVLMLVAILFQYFLFARLSGERTFDIEKLMQIPLSSDTQFFLFIAYAIAFAIKVPIFPFHTWLPDAHVEAPTAISVILAGVLLKMGTYGFLRFCLPLFPVASYQFVFIISFLAIVGITYGALVAFAQKDIKKLVAYSSVSHLGFVMLGIFAFTYQGVSGGILQMINHGISTGGLFLIVGMLYERRRTRFISDFGGIMKVMPIFSVFFMIVALSSIGLPGTNGFVGEFLILLGTFRSSNPYGIFYAVLAATGVVLSAIYILWMLEKVMFGEIKVPENRNLKDISKREFSVLLPVIILIFWIGLYPSPFLSRIEASVTHLINRIEQKHHVGSSYFYKIGESR